MKIIQEKSRAHGSLTLACLLLSSASAAAGCAADTLSSEPADALQQLTVRRGSDVVAAIERFSPPESVDAMASQAGSEPVAPAFLAPVVGEAAPQTRQLGLALSYVATSLRNRPGFVAAAVLNGQQGEVAVYSQWKVDGDAPKAFPSEWSVGEALSGSGVQRVDARTFVVDFTAPSPQLDVSKVTSPHAHFGVFIMDPSSQERLLELARESAPKSIGTPGLNGISFHRSLDGGEVINLGVWTDFGGLAELLSRPGFQGGDEYWLGVASFHNVWFDVAAVVTAS